MLVCPVCQLDYTTQGEQQPRLLVTCGHTFCRKCLDSQPNSESAITCPQCSILSSEPHVPNISIMNFVEAQEASSRPPPVMHNVPAPVKAICQDCKRNRATIVCFQCLPSGFRFCDTCSEREHGRSFGPVREHVPKPIDKVKISTPIPTCPTHVGEPCLFFSFKENAFACGKCREMRDFSSEDNFVSIDVAVSRVREEVPSLMELLRERVNMMSSTRAELDTLLGRVDQEKRRSLDRVQIEFNQFEMALKKRMSDILTRIEEEARYQSKELLQQQENLEIAQGNTDTAIVRANWLLQMIDYKCMHQAESIISGMKALLSDEELPMYRSPATTGEIPMYLPAAFVDEIEKLGTIGGGKMPTRLKTFSKNGLLYISWESSDANVMEYEISFEPFEGNDTDPTDIITSSGHSDFPRSVKVKGTFTETLIDDVMVNTRYLFRVRALNVAGWGVWSNPVVGKTGNFPLEIGYTGKIVEFELPKDGVYSIVAYGAKAADGNCKNGGRGAIIGAKFELKKYDKLIILCGGMSTKILSSTGGGGGTFVAMNKRRDILLVAGGGGGTRGHDEEDMDGTDASLSESGCDGIGLQWAHGGAGGGAGKDAATFTAPSWGHGGAGFTAASSTGKSFLHGGEAGEGGGFGGGGAIGQYGGGGGGGYSGGGGGRGGGGGGSYIRADGKQPIKELGNEGHGFVKIEFCSDIVIM